MSRGSSPPVQGDSLSLPAQRPSLTRLASSDVEPMASSTPPTSVDLASSSQDDDTRRIRRKSGKANKAAHVGSLNIAKQRPARPIANGTLDRWLTAQASTTQTLEDLGESVSTASLGLATEAATYSGPVKQKCTHPGPEEPRTVDLKRNIATAALAGDVARHKMPSKKARRAKTDLAVSRGGVQPRRSRRGVLLGDSKQVLSRPPIASSLQIDMCDLTPRELSLKAAVTAHGGGKEKRRRWKGWAEVDEDGNEIIPLVMEGESRQPDSKYTGATDQATTHNSSPEPSILLAAQIHDKRYNKTMERLGKFYSGQPENSIFPLPHNFSMAKFGPDDKFLKPRDICRTYKLSAEIFNPLNEVYARDIKDWHVTRGNKNTFVGEARRTWIKSDLAKLPVSVCICTADDPCDDETCWNRSMGYECNEVNCPLEDGKCRNRPFSELAQRTEKTELVNNRQRELEKHNAERDGRRPNFHSVLMSFDQGVEVSKAGGKGFGVRAQRNFMPGQIIMEYFGEIIDEDEKFARMATVYKDNKDFYMMSFVNGFTLDATKGSMARFVNHSCDPNCEIRQMLVRVGEGKKASVEPRLALFAVNNIKFGDELSYDYNFENFNEDNKQQCLCGASNCRGYLGPRLAKDRRKEV